MLRNGELFDPSDAEEAAVEMIETKPDEQSRSMEKTAQQIIKLLKKSCPDLAEMVQTFFEKYRCVQSYQPGLMLE